MLEYFKNRMHGWKTSYTVIVHLTESIKITDKRGRTHETKAVCAYGRKKKEVECARELAISLKNAGLAIEDVSDVIKEWS